MGWRSSSRFRRRKRTYAAISCLSAALRALPIERQLGTFRGIVAECAYGFTHPTLPATEQWPGMRIRMMSSICPIVSPADPVVRLGVAGSAEATGARRHVAATVRVATARERRTPDPIGRAFRRRLAAESTLNRTTGLYNHRTGDRKAVVHHEVFRSTHTKR